MLDLCDGPMLNLCDGNMLNHRFFTLFIKIVLFKGFMLNKDFNFFIRTVYGSSELTLLLKDTENISFFHKVNV